MRNVFSFSREN